MCKLMDILPLCQKVAYGHRAVVGQGRFTKGGLRWGIAPVVQMGYLGGEIKL